MGARDAKVNKMPFYENLEAYIKSMKEFVKGEHNKVSGQVADKYEWTTEKVWDKVSGFDNLVQGSQAWIFMPSEDMFVQTAMQGIGIAIAFAFVVVLVATGNIINTVIAIFCVGTVILSITACFHIGG